MAGTTVKNVKFGWTARRSKLAVCVGVAAVAMCFMAVLLAGCSSSSKEPIVSGTSLTSDEITSLFDDSSKFEGKTITISGQVLSQPDLGDGTQSFNMYQDPNNRANIVAVTYDGTDLALSGDDYVTVSGTVGKPEQKVDSQGNVFDIVTIEATSVTECGYKDAAEPALDSRDVNVTLDKDGYSITVTSIEFARDETRIYFSAANNADATFGLRTYDAVATQSGIKYDQTYNKIAKYTQPNLTLESGNSTVGVLTFPAMDHSAEIVLDTDATVGADQEVQTFEFTIK